MSHEIARSIAGSFLVAHKDAAPWHIAETNSREMPATATDAEVCNAAGFEHRIARAKVRYPVNAADANNPAAWATMDDRHVLINRATGKPIGIVSDQFEIFQPWQCRDLAIKVAKSLDGYVDVAGQVFDGAGLFINIRAGESLRVVGSDIVNSNFAIITRNDGTMNLLGKSTETRVVCRNTMAIAIADKAHKRDFRLSHRSELNIESLHAHWSAALDAHKSQVEQYRILAQHGIAKAAAESIVFDLFNAKRAEEDRQDPDAIVPAGKRDIRNSTGYQTILRLFNGAGMGATMQGVKGTAWGLLNACTEYVDHHATAQSVSHRWQSATMGQGADLKADAFARLIALATGQSVEATTA